MHCVSGFCVLDVHCVNAPTRQGRIRGKIKQIKFKTNNMALSFSPFLLFYNPLIKINSKNYKI